VPEPEARQPPKKKVRRQTSSDDEFEEETWDARDEDYAEEGEVWEAAREAPEPTGFDRAVAEVQIFIVAYALVTKKTKMMTMLMMMRMQMQLIRDGDDGGDDGDDDDDIG
jgi:hypothetical protein